MTATDAIIYLRLSDFRDEDDATFTAREDELRAFAADLGLTVVRVAVENDNGNGHGKSRAASAYKTPLKVTTSSGLVTFRTNRPVFQGVALDLQHGAAGVLIVSDDSRISRDHRDGRDLLDACRVSGASAVAPDDEGRPRWILTRGGTHAEVSAFQDRIDDARKYSDSIAAKVRKGRQRWAGKSYQGGRRPFGYRHDPKAPEHRKRLIVVPAEAKLIQAAADDIDRKISLKAIARDLREGGVPTVSGAPWSAETLRAVLLKPAVAGLAVTWVRDPETGERVQVLKETQQWDAILERGRWEALRDKLTDPARRTNLGRVPRWLVSGFAVCGVCGGRTRVIGGANRAPAYTGSGCAHVRRNAQAVDAHVAGQVIWRLSQPDADGLLRPPPRPDVDVPKLRAQARKLARDRGDQLRLHRQGIITAAELEDSLRGFAADLAAIEAQLAVSDQPDPLPEFREGRPAEAVWAGLSLARRRAVVQTIVGSIVIKTAGRRGAGFDPATVLIIWAPGV